MIKTLKEIEQNKILELLEQPELWKSKLIDYEPPIVERVYLQLEEYRLSLHFIHPCEDSLVHPHVWQSAMHVVEGTYEMGLFLPDYNDRLVPVSTLISEGSFYYEMLEEKAQHYVKPIGGVCKSVMLTGQPIWKNNQTNVTKKLVDLTEDRKLEILNYFKKHYGR